MLKRCITNLATMGPTASNVLHMMLYGAGVAIAGLLRAVNDLARFTNRWGLACNVKFKCRAERLV